MRHRNFFDIFFSLSLLCVFVVCSASILLYQIDRYEMQIQRNEAREETRLVQSFITTLFHQQSATQAFEKEVIEGVDCLVVTDTRYQTVKYIYAYDGYVRELYQDDQMDVDLMQGDPIAPAVQLRMNKEQTLFTFTLTKDDERCEFSLNAQEWMVQ